ncbi:MAG: hypothetical protein LBI67_04540 [Treponema sp.]|jgi:hypothetical protein|nr:hypothetical protein [Treponema sp.]
MNTNIFALEARNGIIVCENKTLGSVNSTGSTFSIFGDRYHNPGLHGGTMGQGSPPAIPDYADPFILFCKKNASARTDMVRIAGRLENDSEYLHALRGYVFRISLLLRDLEFFPLHGNVSGSSLDSAQLDDYAVTVHGVKAENAGIDAVEAAIKAEKLEEAARAGDSVFLAENAPVFLEYMECFVTCVIKLIEEMIGKEEAAASRRLRSRRGKFGPFRGFGNLRRKRPS